MVHKKSEYTLQFHVLPNDLRKQIWQENIKFREFRRSVNRADHFWSYQLIDKCDCESDNEDVDQIKENSHGIKYADLATVHVTTYDQEDSNKKQNKVNLIDNCKSTFKSIGVQTALATDNVHPGKTSNNETFGSETAGESNSQASEKKYKKSDVIRTDSSQYSGRQNKSKKLSCDSKSSPLRHGALKSSDCSRLKKAKELHSSSAQELQLHPSSSVQLYPRYTRRARSAGTLRPSSVCSKSSTSVSRQQRSPSPRFSVLSRTSRRSHMEHPRSTFTAFGWNDTKKNVGDKKTYNVLAPYPEVYPLALQAMKNRQKEIEEYLAQETQILNASQTTMNTVNHSSIWMSEYRDKFSRPPTGKSIQTHLSSPGRRSVLWSVS